MAKGRQPGVLAFGFKSFLEGVIRQKEGVAFDREPTIAQKERIDKSVTDLREAMKLEKQKEVKISGDAGNTIAVLNLFLSQFRESLTDTVETNTSLREQLIAERVARDSLMARMAELEAQLERATKKKSA